MMIELLYAEDHGEDKMLIATNITQNGETTKVAYIIPRETWEWRVAEYDLDPEDTETALDILLHSPHVNIPQGEGLYDGVTVEAAREALLSRVRDHRKNSDTEKAARTALRKASDPEVAVRGQILGLLHKDPEVIAVKREVIAIHRQRADEERAKAKPARDRLADMKLKLKEMKDAGIDHVPPAADQA